jgi:hypothetical protein
MISYKPSFIVVLWIAPCCSLMSKVVCKCNWYYCSHLITFYIVERSNNNMFQINFLLLAFFVMLHSILLWWVRTHYNGPKMAIENWYKSPYPIYFELNEIELQIKTFKW